MISQPGRLTTLRLSRCGLEVLDASVSLLSSWLFCSLTTTSYDVSIGLAVLPRLRVCNILTWFQCVNLRVLSRCYGNWLHLSLANADSSAQQTLNWASKYFVASSVHLGHNLLSALSRNFTNARTTSDDSFTARGSLITCLTTTPVRYWPC